jgi:hypothetical protein
MNEVELRRKVDKEVSAPDIELLWKWLKEDHYVSEVSRGDCGWEEFKAEADRLANRQWQMSGRVKPPGRAAQAIVDVDLDDYENECAEVVSLYLAKKVASLPEVRRFRQERLGGRVLSADEATEFLKCEALSELPDFDSRREEFTYFAWVKDMSAEELADFVIPRGRTGIVSGQDEIFPDSYQSPPVIVIGSRGKLDYGGLVLYLAAIFPWAPDRAGWFLLTGERPKVVPLRFTYHRRRQVFTLSFTPWISEKTVRKAYRKAQKVVQGGDNRRMKERTLAVMRFVTEHTNEEGRRLLSWAQLTDLWNEQHPGEWSFKDRFGLRKAYLRAEKELARPWR